jgi:outer membrane cobalamin receptor
LIASLGSVVLVASPVRAEATPGNTGESSQSTTTGEQSPRTDSTRDSNVEEMVVYGVQTGALPSIPGPSTQILFTDDFVAENKSLAELLSEAAGVSVRSFGGAGDRSEVTIRGSTPSQVVITLDGVRVNSILTGGLNLSRVCLPLIEKVAITS